MTSSPAARWLLAPCRKGRIFLRSASTSCLLWDGGWGFSPLSIPRLLVAVRPSFSRPVHLQIVGLWKWWTRLFTTLWTAVQLGWKGRRSEELFFHLHYFLLPSFLASFHLSSFGIKKFEVKLQGGEFFTIVNSNVCPSPLLKAFGSTKGAHAARAKVLMKLALLCSSSFVRSLKKVARVSCLLPGKMQMLTQVYSALGL